MVDLVRTIRKGGGMKTSALLFCALLSGCTAGQAATFFGAMNAGLDGASRSAPLAMDTAYLVNGTVPPPGYYQPQQQQQTVIQPLYQQPRRSMAATAAGY